MTQEPVTFSFGPCTFGDPTLEGCERVVRLIEPAHATAVAEFMDQGIRLTAERDAAKERGEELPARSIFDRQLVATALPLVHRIPGLVREVLGACLRDSDGNAPDVSQATLTDAVTFLRNAGKQNVFASLKDLLGNALALASA